MHEFDPLDEYPIHQVPLPMRYPGTSDRNFYDRCIYQGIDHEADTYFITGLGVYPTSASSTRTRRCGKATASGRCAPRALVPTTAWRRQSGPYRIEVVEPFHALRLICDADEHGIGFDLMYRSEYGPIAEPQHIRRQGDRILLDASRFAGVGTFDGELRVDGETIPITPDRFTATRDRSWGIRPVGEAEPPGQTQRVHGHVVVLDPAALRRLRAALILEEDMHGVRNTNFAVRVWPEASGRPAEQLGWPLPEIQYDAGHAQSRPRLDRSHDARRQGLDPRDRSDHRHSAQRRLRLRNGPRVDARTLEGRGWVEGSDVRPQRSRAARSRRVLDCGTTSRASRSTATKAGASSSTAASAPRRRRASPTSVSRPGEGDSAL